MSMSIHLDNPPKKEHNQKLTIKQRAFIKNLSKGHNQTESAILAGYSRKSADVIGSKLASQENIIRALDQAKFDDKHIVEGLKRNFDEGIGVKATADTSVKVAELVLKLKGYLNKEQEGTTNNTQNIYINELNTMSDEQLEARYNALQEVTGTIK